jgi:glycogen synthase
MKKTIVLASVLKPIDDARMYEKIACTLASIPQYRIHVIGFKATVPPTHPDITFHPLFGFHRLSVKRLWAPIKYFKKLLKLRPSVIIVSSPDLLIVTYAYRIIFASKILYDVQENYYRNILYTDTYPRMLRPLLAGLVRMVEKLTAPAILHFFLAEQCYARELPFVKNRFTVLENKYLPQPSGSEVIISRLLNSERFHLVFSGTISESYGIFRAIDLICRLHALDSRFHLTIIGYCAQPAVYERISDQIRELPFINMVAGRYLVPHLEIIKAIRGAGVGVLAYQLNESYRDRIPTKLYEYLYHGLYIVLPANAEWLGLVTEHGIGAAIDFDKYQECRIALGMLDTCNKDYINVQAILWDGTVLVNLNIT